MTQRKLYVFLGLNTIWCYTLLCAAFWTSENLVLACFVAVIAIWWASPLTMCYARNVWEELGDEMPPFDLRTGAWSFLIGDPFVLPQAAICMVNEWNRSDFGAWSGSIIWFAGCLAIGLAVGTAFHWLDGMNYHKVDAESALKSPTKLAHDFVAYPVLFGGLLYGGVPLLFNWSGWSALSLAFVLVWVALALLDFLRGLDFKKLHPDWLPDIFLARVW